MEIIVLTISAIILVIVIIALESRQQNEPQLDIDTSSFSFGCPVKGCGWYMQSQEDLDEHMRVGKHGVDEERSKLTTTM